MPRLIAVALPRQLQIGDRQVGGLIHADVQKHLVDAPEVAQPRLERAEERLPVFLRLGRHTVAQLPQEADQLTAAAAHTRQ